MTPPRVLAAAGVSAGGNPGKGGSGSLPLIRPCGATFPQGGRLGCCWRQCKPPRGVGDAAPCGLPGEWAAAGGRGGVGAPRPTDGDMETLWGLRGHPFPGRRAVGAGHARPGGLRGHPSTVRSVGRGLDPSAGGCPGDGRWREPSRGVGDAAPCGLPGMGGRGEPAPHPALRGHLPPRGKARAAWRQRKPPPTPAAGPRCGAGGSGCSTSGLTKPALYRRNPGRCRGGSRR